MAKTVSEVCPKWGQQIKTASINQWRVNTPTRQITPKHMLDRLHALDVSQSFWRGYDAVKPFDIPEKVRVAYRFEIHTELGKRFIYVYDSVDTPEQMYGFAYVSMKPFADANGEHYGTHPCSVFYVPSKEVLYFWDESEVFKVKPKA